jgi:hypothetical protein
MHSLGFDIAIVLVSAVAVAAFIICLCVAAQEDERQEAMRKGLTTPEKAGDQDKK